jgi:hypothetical protein
VDTPVLPLEWFLALRVPAEPLISDKTRRSRSVCISSK